MGLRSRITTSCISYEFSINIIKICEDGQEHATIIHRRSTHDTMRKRHRALTTTFFQCIILLVIFTCFRGRAFCRHALYIILLRQVRKIFMYNRKWEKPGNATITDYRQTHGLKIRFSLELQYMYMYDRSVLRLNGDTDLKLQSVA